MSFFGELVKDIDYTHPRVIVTDDMALLENVAAIVMLSETAITVSHGLKLLGHGSRLAEKTGRQHFTTITGQNLIIKEIYEGRVIIGGTVQRAEFL